MRAFILVLALVMLTAGCAHTDHRRPKPSDTEAIITVTALSAAVVFWGAVFVVWAETTRPQEMNAQDIDRGFTGYERPR